MVEYQGRCDENGKAVGHAPKVMNEYYNFIKAYSNVTVVAPNTILKELTYDANKFELSKHIVMKGKTPFIEKITNKLNMFSNTKAAYKCAERDHDSIVWFFNVEYFFMLWCALSPVIKKTSQRSHGPKVVLTMFIDGFHAPENASIIQKLNASLKQWVFEKAQKKFDIIIATGEKFKYKNTESVFIPDYYYIPEIFDAHRSISKNDEAVCLGTMGRGKQLTQMVDAFNRIGYPLTIAGRFYDKSLLSELKAKANSNIKIIDDYLSNEEYLSMLAKAKYTVLPYSYNYANQTSGVMQEAMFLGTVPVTYKAILDGNCMEGIGFDSWDSLNASMLSSDVSPILSNYDKKINGPYSKSYASKNFRSIFAK